MTLLMVLLTLSSACAAQEKKEPATQTQGAQTASGDSGKGWVPLPSGSRMYYEVAGGAKSDTIVVPGAAFWSSALAPLAQNHTVIFYDLLGRGRSDSASSSRIVMDSILADLDALRNHFHLGQLKLIGVSVNGLVTAAYAAAHPDRVSRLALVNPIAPTAQEQSAYKPPERNSRVDSAAQKEMLHLRETGGSHEAICRQFWKASGGWFVGDKAAASRIDPTWCALPNENLDASLLWLGTLSSNFGQWDLTKAAHGIKAPTLVVSAQRDYFASPKGAKEWAAVIPGAKLVTLPGVGHLVLFEKPEAALTPLQNFFAGR